jgi:hypothetical protein
MPAPLPVAVAAADPGTTASQAGSCPNCGQAYGPVRPNYCPACGQESHVRPPTLREFAQQFGGSYLAAEGALWRTLALLLRRPGQLTREYLAGRRRHYVLPLRLYLTISLVTLLVLRGLTLLPAPAELPPEAAAELARAKTGEHSIDFGFGRARIFQGVLECSDLPGWLCDGLQRRLATDPSRFGREVANASDQFLSHWGSAMFLLVPIFAAAMAVAYRRRRMRYTEHLVFALHVHAFWFVAILATALLPSALAWIGILALPVYALLAAHRVYGGRWMATLLRNLVVAAVYGTVLGLAMGVVAMWSFLG